MLAVPIELQCPAEGALSVARSRNSSSSISPAASLRRLRQMTVPEPTCETLDYQLIRRDSDAAPTLVRRPIQGKA